MVGRLLIIRLLLPMPRPHVSLLCKPRTGACLFRGLAIQTTVKVLRAYVTVRLPKDVQSCFALQFCQSGSSEGCSLSNAATGKTRFCFRHFVKHGSYRPQGDGRTVIVVLYVMSGRRRLRTRPW